MKSIVCVVAGLIVAGAAWATNPVVVMETSMGSIKIELFEEQSPVTVKNFLAYVDDKYYDGTIFHRVMGRENSGKDFVVQGGGWIVDANATLGMKEKPGAKPPIICESGNGIKNERGTIAMARTKDPNSATSQFYFNVVDNSGRLDKQFAADKVGYCAFGKVIEGLDVIDKIKAVKTTRKNEEHANVPTEPITIKSVKRQPDKKPDEKP